MNPTESGIALRFHVSEGRRHHGRLLWEWLLELARELDLPGGTAYRALAGYGRHRRLHEAHFFELAGDAPIDVIFILRPADEARLLERIDAEGLALFYARMPIEFGITGPAAG